MTANTAAAASHWRLGMVLIPELLMVSPDI
jgi:hypothetical protein